MATKGIKAIGDMKPGDLYTTNGSDIWEVVSFCELPTVTLKNLRNGEECGGGVGCLNLSQFMKVPMPDGN